MCCDSEYVSENLSTRSKLKCKWLPTERVGGHFYCPCAVTRESRLGSLVNVETRTEPVHYEEV